MAGKQGQTATEFIVFLAIVLILTLIVMVTFTDVTFFSKKTPTVIEQMAMYSQPISVTGISSNSLNTTFYVRNNAHANITLQGIFFDNVSTQIPVQELVPGQVAWLNTSALTVDTTELLDGEVEIRFNFTITKPDEQFIFIIPFTQTVLFS